MKTLAIVGILAVLLAIQPIPAGDYNVRTRQTYNNHQTYRQIARLVDIVRIDPAYTSAYDPRGYDSATQDQLLAELHKIGARLDANAAERIAREAAQVALLQQLAIKQGLPGVPQPPAAVAPPPAVKPPAEAVVKPPPAAPLSGLTVLVTHCAACHQDGKLLPNQRFILLDNKGQLSPLTDRQKLAVLAKVYSGQMPPPQNTAGATPVTDPEFAAIVEQLR